MEHPSKIHNEIYALLMNHRETNPDCRFTFRRSNRDNRLAEGYWFYGNDHYLDVSFWSGMDWKNKTPNIVFAIIIETGETFLEISTSDSDVKRRFVVQHLVDALGMESRGQRFRKPYTSMGANYLESLSTFLATDKVLVDDIIGLHSDTFFPSEEEKIGFIKADDFELKLEKVIAYRAELEGKAPQTPTGISDKPQRIASLKIGNFGPIQEVEIEEIPFGTQWIFFTGENGTGKTSLLRGLATALCNRPTIETELTPDRPFRVSFSLQGGTQPEVDFERSGNEHLNRGTVLTSGFAGYGQSRLRTGHIPALYQPKSSLSESLYASLFSVDSVLIDLQSQFDDWQNDIDLLTVYDKRKAYITEILTDILPNLYNIDYNDRNGDSPTTSYIERDHDGGEFKKVRFEQLASGLKSMIAMIGDIMVKLYVQQPTVFDPAEFTGVVLIDEIDIHLHPKLQKELVEQLTRTFPKIQFIASTHSPISLLGAPKNSLIFKVERNARNGVTLQRLDDKLILGDLLPNAILTSPIFGLQDIIPNSHEPGRLVRTENNFADVTFNDTVKRKIDEFVTDEKEQELIQLFKSRRL